MRKRRLTQIEMDLAEQLELAADRLSFLSEVSQVLSGALSDRECFRRLLELVVPRFADWGTLTISADGGELERVAAAHADPTKRGLVIELANRFPPHRDDPGGPGFTIHHGRPEFEPEYGRHFEKHAARIRYPGLVELLRILGVESKISVPILAHGRVIGALWMATSDSGRVFDREDLKLAVQVAARAGAILFHLKRYSCATQEIDRLRIEIDVREQYLAHLRHDVRSVMTGALLSAQLVERSDDTRVADLGKRIVRSIRRATDIMSKAQHEEPWMHQKKAS